MVQYISIHLKGASEDSKPNQLSKDSNLGKQLDVIRTVQLLVGTPSLNTGVKVAALSCCSKLPP